MGKICAKNDISRLARAVHCEFTDRIIKLEYIQTQQWIYL